MDKADLSKRLGAASLAFFGVIIAAPDPIMWSDPKFIAAIGLVMVPALLNSSDKVVGGKGAAK